MSASYEDNQATANRLSTPAVISNPAPAEHAALIAQDNGIPLDNPAHEVFAALTLRYSASEAYRRALAVGARVKPSTVHEGACRLMARPEVKRRIAELKAAGARESAIEVDHSILAVLPLDLLAVGEDVQAGEVGDLFRHAHREFASSAGGAR